jgi:hypothetical protein
MVAIKIRKAVNISSVLARVEDIRVVGQLLSQPMLTPFAAQLLGAAAATLLFFGCVRLSTTEAAE